MARVLGLDLGSHSLKALLVDVTARGTTPLAWTELRRTEDGPLDQAVAALAAERAWAADQVVVSLPGTGLVTQAFTLPFSDPKRIAATLPFEVEGQLPFDVSEVVFDHLPTQRRADGTDLLVGMVRRDELTALLRTLEAAGLDPRIVTHPAIAYQALLLSAPSRFEVAPGATVALVDVGHRRTCVAVGRPAEGLVFARCFAGGGRDLTRALAAEFAVGPAEAETWKEAHASLLPSTEPDHARAGAAVLRALAPIVRELRATLKASSSRGHLPVGRVLLAGGTSRLPGLAEHVSGALGVPADVLLLPPEAAATIAPEVQPRAAQAWTLAHSSGRGVRFNLRKGDLAFRGHFDYLRERLIRVGVFASVLALLLVAFSITRAVVLGRRERAVDARLCELTQRVLGTCEKDWNRAMNLLRGKESPAAAVPRVSASNLLAEVVQRTPPDVSVTYGQVVIDLDRLQLRGETDSTRSIDKVAAALKQYRCFREVKEGKVERTKESRVQFQLEVQVDCGDGATGGSGT